MLYLLYLDIVQRCSVEDEVLVYYELIVLGFNDELREKVSGDVGLMKDSGVNDLMMKKGDDELLNVKLK
jgi:hypothetical protein